MSLEQLPFDGESYLKDLANKFPESKFAYSKCLVNGSSSFVNIHRNLVTDPLLDALHTTLPETWSYRIHSMPR